jgi:hypothetical protein
LNVFYLNRDPVIAAQESCNKHVVKVILESAQMLSTAHRVCDGDDYANTTGMYKMAHKNHPTTIWVRSGVANYDWLWRHMTALMREYTYRYDKHHATERLTECLARTPTNIPYGVKFTDPPQCMPDNCKGDDTVLAYQTYYIVEKSGFAQWKRRRRPEWFNEDTKRILLGLHGKKIA